MILVMIDGIPYTIAGPTRTGRQLRDLARIPDDRDLYLETAGAREDVLIAESGTVDLSVAGVFAPRFYSVPRLINAGVLR